MEKAEKLTLPYTIMWVYRRKQERWPWKSYYSFHSRTRVYEVPGHVGDVKLIGTKKTHFSLSKLLLPGGRSFQCC